MRVQSTRIFKLFLKFENTHSVAKRLFRHAGGGLYIRPCRPAQPPGPGYYATGVGRIYNPPLREGRERVRRGGLHGRPYGPHRWFAADLPPTHPPRRGRCPHRPARPEPQRAPAMAACGHAALRPPRRSNFAARGGLPGGGGRTRHARPCGGSVHRAPAGIGDCFRAGIKPAPTTGPGAKERGGSTWTTNRL